MTRPYLRSSRGRVTGLLCAALIAALLLCALGCGRRLKTDPCAARAEAGDALHCAVPGYTDRGYDLIVPAEYGAKAAPLIVALHGGGGNRAAALRTTCAGGDITSATCLHAMAAARGYVVVFPDGTPSRMVRNLRTWNAGGGGGDWRCTSGYACAQGVDDVAYLGALLDDVSRRVSIDPKRVYLTGLSNGGAMSYRAACAMADRVAAIAPVGGGMQLTVNGTCAPSRPVPVLHTHGTADTCWQYAGGVPSCANGLTGQPGKKHVSIARTMEEWRVLNRCDAQVVETALPDTRQDGTTTTRRAFQKCAADTVLLQINGGGHTWPGGYQYLRPGAVGPVPQDWGNEVLLDWFDAHRLP